MTIEELGAIGELLGSVLVLVTLLYLARQIQIARKTMTISAVGELRKAFSNVNQNVIADEAIALLYSKGLKDPSGLTEGEEIRFRMLVREAFSGYQDLYQKVKVGDLDKSTFDSFGFNVFLSLPGVIKFIESQLEFMDEDLKSYVMKVPKVELEKAYSAIMGGPPRDV